MSLGDWLEIAIFHVSRLIRSLASISSVMVIYFSYKWIFIV